MMKRLDRSPEKLPLQIHSGGGIKVRWRKTVLKQLVIDNSITLCCLPHFFHLQFFGTHYIDYTKEVKKFNHLKGWVNFMPADAAKVRLRSKLVMIVMIAF